MNFNDLICPRFQKKPVKGHEEDLSQQLKV